MYNFKTNKYSFIINKLSYQSLEANHRLITNNN